MRMNDEISKEEFCRMKDSLDNQILGLTTAQNEVKTDELNIEADLEYARQFIQNPARQWQDMDVSQKQRFQQRIFPYGIIYDKTKKSYGTAVLSAIFTLSEDFHTSKSDFVAGARHQTSRRLPRVRLAPRNPAVPVPPPRENSRFPDPLPLRVLPPQHSKTKTPHLGVFVLLCWGYGTKLELSFMLNVRFYLKNLRQRDGSITPE